MEYYCSIDMENMTNIYEKLNAYAYLLEFSKINELIPNMDITFERQIEMDNFIIIETSSLPIKMEGIYDKNIMLKLQKNISTRDAEIIDQVIGEIDLHYMCENRIVTNIEDTYDDIGVKIKMPKIYLDKIKEKDEEKLSHDSFEQLAKCKKFVCTTGTVSFWASEILRRVNPNCEIVHVCSYIKNALYLQEFIDSNLHLINSTIYV